MKKKFFKGLLLAAVTLVQGMMIPAASMVKMPFAPLSTGRRVSADRVGLRLGGRPMALRAAPARGSWRLLE
jgi:hypothetical protein